jgi:hypothetical protein
LSFIACSSPGCRARSERTPVVEVNFALEMFLLVEVHEEKRLKEDAGSVYFREMMNDE